EIIGKVLMHSPRSIRSKRPEVPEGLALVIDRCLDRDRERRFRNVAQLALALAPFASPSAQLNVQRITALLVSGELGTGPAIAPMVEPVPASPAALSHPA